jgi:hypothetical protein
MEHQLPVEVEVPEVQLLVLMVVPAHNFQRHLEIHYHNQLQLLEVVWEHLDQEALIGGLLLVAAELLGVLDLMVELVEAAAELPALINLVVME